MHGELPLTMLSVIHDRDMVPTNNDVNVTNTLTDRREVDYRPSPLKAKRTMTLQGAHFTKRTIRVYGQEVQSEFLPDTGSISKQCMVSYRLLC